MKRLWTNGAIYTMESPAKTVEAVLVENGKIVSVGERVPLQALADEVIDLQGGAMYPGFVDSHLHMIGYGDKLQRLDVSDVKSATELLQKVKLAAKSLQPGEWLIGDGWNENQFTDGVIPSKEELDTIITGSEVLVPTVNRIVMKGGRAPARGDGEWFWPTNFPYSISSRYAYRCIFGTCRSHTGIDITGTGRGSPIYAARDGVVTKIEYNAGGLGYYVQIKHDNGYYTQYGHMCNANGGDSAGGTNSAYKYIKVGDRVKAGFRIGDMGSSGSSTGVHLHFEIWGGVPYQASSYDPLTFY